jgi:hypothetical protein
MATKKLLIKKLIGLQKIKKDTSPELTTSLKHTITSVDGDREKKRYSRIYR